MVIATFIRIPQRFIGCQVSDVTNQMKRNKIRKFMNCRLLETAWQELYHYELVLLLCLPQVLILTQMELSIGLGVTLWPFTENPGHNCGTSESTVEAMHS